MVNVSGAMVLGVVATVLLERVHVSEAMRIGLTVGLLGGYTTFSTLSLDSVHLIQDGRWWWGLMTSWSAARRGWGRLGWVSRWRGSSRRSRAEAACFPHRAYEQAQTALQWETAGAALGSLDDLFPIRTIQPACSIRRPGSLCGGLRRRLRPVRRRRRTAHRGASGPAAADDQQTPAAQQGAVTQQQDDAAPPVRVTTTTQPDDDAESAQTQQQTAQQQKRFAL